MQTYVARDPEQTGPLEPGVHGIDDVGTKGEMAAILNSFRFGP